MVGEVGIILCYFVYSTVTTKVATATELSEPLSITWTRGENDNVRVTGFGYPKLTRAGGAAPIIRTVIAASGPGRNAGSSVW